MLLRLIVRRTGTAILTLWLAFTLAFCVLRVLPGDAVTATLIRSGASDEQIAARRTALGLNQPVTIQYVQALAALLRGDLGTSLMSGRPVSQMIGEQLGATVTLAAGGLCLGTLIGIGLGLSTLLRSRLLRGIAFAVMTVLLSAPVYWIGTLIIYLFSIALHLLPSAGNQGIQALLLPWLALGLSLAGGIARVTASSLNDLRHADFIRTAHAKGLRPYTVAVRHLLRVGFGPILSVIGLQAGFLLGGTVITEALFVRQGIGQVMLSAVQDRDFPVVQGIVLLSALTYSVIAVLVDVLSAALDPRIRANAATSEA